LSSDPASFWLAYFSLEKIEIKKERDEKERITSPPSSKGKRIAERDDLIRPGPSAKGRGTRRETKMRKARGLERRTHSAMTMRGGRASLNTASTRSRLGKLKRIKRKAEERGDYFLRLQDWRKEVHRRFKGEAEKEKRQNLTTINRSPEKNRVFSCVNAKTEYSGRRLA